MVEIKPRSTRGFVTGHGSGRHPGDLQSVQLDRTTSPINQSTRRTDRLRCTV